MIYRIIYFIQDAINTNWSDIGYDSLENHAINIIWPIFEISTLDIMIDVVETMWFWFFVLVAWQVYKRVLKPNFLAGYRGGRGSAPLPVEKEYPDLELHNPDVIKLARAFKLYLFQ